MVTENLKKFDTPVFPFTAIVGQEEMKLALQLNVIDPKIGGVMIMGDRGTGKSTTVRALVDLLPEIQVVVDDPFNSDPTDPELMSQEVRDRISNNETLPVISKKITMVDLPLGATEDRVCGTIDIEKALTEGIKAFEPGLLAKANRGLLYVDEVNLLDEYTGESIPDQHISLCLQLIFQSNEKTLQNKEIEEILSENHAQYANQQVLIKINFDLLLV